MSKFLKLLSVLMFAGAQCFAQADFEDSISTKQLDEIVISGTRAGKNTPVAYEDISKNVIEKRNLGQDMPYMLAGAQSLVYTSDAGAGIGYTSMRIRGSDATRINVTINGIPYNDAESQGTFWVNLPDFASSVNSVQIQRGVGTSTNGSGAFGATVNMETGISSNEAYAEWNGSYGSFNSLKNTIKLNSGLLDGKWIFEGKLAKISSDGYIDRATSNLGSYYLSGNYIGKNTIVRALVFGGEEVTYQAWNGIDENTLETDRTYNSAGLYYDAEGNPQFYDREVDNYDQDHYQLYLNQQLNQFWSFNAALHYTKGQGYYEQYKTDQSFIDYGLPDVVIGDSVITETDLIRRRWLDNDFYGFIYGVNLEQGKWNAVLGGGYNYYEGDHFGQIIWAQYSSTAPIRYQYYNNVGKKKDFNTYLKVNYDLSPKLNFFGDMQVRWVDYNVQGVDNDQRYINVANTYTFLNPKFGLTYRTSLHSSLYASYAVGNREPDRNDFIDSPVLPQNETLGDLEIGYNRTGKKYTFEANFYYMDYKNQLVLTGALNDVGGSIRTNVADSYRTGIELALAYSFSDQFSWSVNATYSQNKISEYEENLNDYLEGGIVTNVYNNTAIAYSPNMIGTSKFTYTPKRGLDMILFSKYVGSQYLDNTQNESRKLNAYFVNDIIVNYTFSTKFVKEIGLNLLVNNVFNAMYESNGYAFGYMYGEEYREAYYYPQAGINLLAGVSLRF